MDLAEDTWSEVSLGISGMAIVVVANQQAYSNCLQYIKVTDLISACESQSFSNRTKKSSSITALDPRWQRNFCVRFGNLGVKKAKA